MLALSRFERLIAWRYLRPRRREGFVSVITAFSILGIMLGVATLILVTSLMNGIREEMTSRFIGLDGHVSIYAQGGVSAYTEVMEKLKGLPEVQSAVAKIEGQVMASANNHALGAQVMALPPESYADKPLLAESVDPAALDALKSGEGVIMGERLARNLGLSTGDPVTIISPQGRATFMGMVPRMKAYPLVGTIKLGMHMYDSSLILMPFDEAQVYFQLGTGEEDDEGRASMIELTLRQADDASSLAATLQGQLGGQYRVYDWQRSNATVFGALAIQRNVMVIILTLIVLVAAFNIISSLIMLVQDKGQDIAILRTMGATRRSIMKIFCASGTLIGGVGTLLGLVLGLVLAANIERIKQAVEALTGQEILIEQIYFLSSLPTKTDPAEVALIVLLAIGLSFLATIYPAWRAASLNPAEALRYE